MKCLSGVELMLTTKQFKVDAMALLLIIEVKINLSSSFDNVIIKQTHCKIYMHYIVQLHCTLYHRDQSTVSEKKKKQKYSSCISHDFAVKSVFYIENEAMFETKIK